MTCPLRPKPGGQRTTERSEQVMKNIPMKISPDQCCEGWLLLVILVYGRSLDVGGGAQQAGRRKKRILWTYSDEWRFISCTEILAMAS